MKVMSGNCSPQKPVYAKDVYYPPTLFNIMLEKIMNEALLVHKCTVSMEEE